MNKLEYLNLFNENCIDTITTIKNLIEKGNILYLAFKYATNVFNYRMNEEMNEMMNVMQEMNVQLNDKDEQIKELQLLVKQLQNNK
ncbi:hypothetical protein ABK040_000937 [Willaertia magna]